MKRIVLCYITILLATPSAFGFPVTQEDALPTGIKHPNETLAYHNEGNQTDKDSVSFEFDIPNPAVRHLLNHIPKVLSKAEVIDISFPIQNNYPTDTELMLFGYCLSNTNEPSCALFFRFAHYLFAGRVKTDPILASVVLNSQDQLDYITATHYFSYSDIVYNTIQITKDVVSEVDITVTYYETDPEKYFAAHPTGLATLKGSPSIIDVGGLLSSQINDAILTTNSITCPLNLITETVTVTETSKTTIKPDPVSTVTVGVYQTVTEKPVSTVTAVPTVIGAPATTITERTSVTVLTGPVTTVTVGVYTTVTTTPTTTLYTGDVYTITAKSVETITASPPTIIAGPATTITERAETVTVESCRSRDYEEEDIIDDLDDNKHNNGSANILRDLFSPNDFKENKSQKYSDGVVINNVYNNYYENEYGRGYDDEFSDDTRGHYVNFKGERVWASPSGFYFENGTRITFYTSCSFTGNITKSLLQEENLLKNSSESSIGFGSLEALSLFTNSRSDISNMESYKEESEYNSSSDHMTSCTESEEILGDPIDCVINTVTHPPYCSENGEHYHDIFDF